jgi:hypothetical protein
MGSWCWVDVSYVVPAPKKALFFTPTTTSYFFLTALNFCELYHFNPFVRFYLLVLFAEVDADGGFSGDESRGML